MVDLYFLGVVESTGFDRTGVPSRDLCLGYQIKSIIFLWEVLDSIGPTYRPDPCPERIKKHNLSKVGSTGLLIRSWHAAHPLVNASHFELSGSHPVPKV